jgi:hypothetical protein
MSWGRWYDSRLSWREVGLWTRELPLADFSSGPLRSLLFSPDCFVPWVPTKQLVPRRNHFSLGAQNSRNRSWLSIGQQSGQWPKNENLGDGQMRSLSFIILAFGFVLASSSMAGSVEGSLPGVGTFSYNGSPIAAGSQPLMVAAR